MKKILLSLLFLAFVCTFMHESYAAPKKERIEITTYYPAPYGVYNELTADFLQMTAQNPTGSPQCNSLTAGTIFHSDTGAANTASTMRVCLRVENPVGSGNYQYLWQTLGSGSSVTNITGALTLVPEVANSRNLVLNPVVPDYSQGNSDSITLEKDFHSSNWVLSPNQGASNPCPTGIPHKFDPVAFKDYCLLTNFSVKGANVGIGNKNPTQPLDIVANVGPSTQAANRAIHINGEPLVRTFRLRIRRTNQFFGELPPFAHTQYKCFVAGHSLRYEKKATTVGDEVDSVFWMSQNQASKKWYLNYRKTDADVAAVGANASVYVDVVCYNQALVSSGYYEYASTGWFTPSTPGQVISDYLQGHK